MNPSEDDDATIRTRPLTAPARRNRLVPVLALSAGLLVVSAGLVFWYVLHSPAPTSVSLALRPAEPAPEPRPSPPVPAAAEFTVRDATEADILANRGGPLTIFRLASNPRVLVLDFASLRDQADMLNRMAAFTEKAGMPRDRVMDETALEAAIRAHGDQPDTYYYGHDYSAGALLAFFETADRQNLTLNASEQRLRRLLDQEGMLRPGTLAAVISIPRAEAGSAIDEGARATILRHELSHGEFFSNPAYVEYVRGFWENVMNKTERAAFTRFLAADGYDTSQPELIINETQAYLMHTSDTRFFSAQTVGLAPSSLDRLRAAFLLNMPSGWLRDCTGVPAPVPATRPAAAAAVAPSATAPSTADRRAPRQRSTVVTSRACTLRRTPRARAASMAAFKSRR